MRKSVAILFNMHKIKQLEMKTILWTIEHALILLFQE